MFVKLESTRQLAESKTVIAKKYGLNPLPLLCVCVTVTFAFITLIQL